MPEAGAEQRGHVEVSGCVAGVHRGRPAPVGGAQHFELDVAQADPPPDQGQLPPRGQARHVDVRAEPHRVHRSAGDLLELVDRLQVDDRQHGVLVVPQPLPGRDQPGGPERSGREPAAEDLVGRGQVLRVPQTHPQPLPVRAGQRQHAGRVRARRAVDVQAVAG